MKPSIPDTFPAEITKRVILRVMANIFDPLGLFNPFIFQEVPSTRILEEWNRLRRNVRAFSQHSLEGTDCSSPSYIVFNDSPLYHL